MIYFRLFLILSSSICACGILGMYAIASVAFIQLDSWYSIYSTVVRVISCVALLIIYFLFLYETFK